MLEKHERLLTELAREYADWFKKFQVRLLERDELADEVASGLDENLIWSYKYFWDSVIYPDESGEEVHYRGAGYVEWYEEGADAYAVTNLNEGDSDVIFSEVLLICDDCSDEVDPDCEFCEGEQEVPFVLKPDGSFERD
jgi:hypothetical protein